MSNKIVTDRKYLSRVCKTVPSVEEGERIAAELFQVLSTNQHGIGLSANQIGIQKRVCAINVKEPIYLINPEITETEGETTFVEGCLSFPGKSIRTSRAQHITVTADNYDEEADIDDSGTDGYGWKYDFQSAHENGVILPPHPSNPGVFELKNPNQNIKGVVR